ncbi:hypothetical protein BH10CYA1_BH10CYA1_44420 [soil metagenome]
MDKPPQLKSDIEKSDVELKVSDAEEYAIDRVTPNSKDTATAVASAAPIAKTDQTVDDQVMAHSGKRVKEQEFLNAYKVKQLQTRFKFVAFAAILLAMYLYTVYFIFNDNEKAASALRKFQIAPLFACLGERDIAHYTMTEFSDGKTKETAGLIEQRTKILDNSIAEMEKNGKPAIFTRLGTEQMLMKYGDRANAFKFGDPLITQYPELPSNYFWRAKTDLERMDYVNSVREYKQAAEKLAHLPTGQKQDWQNQLSKAAWASIYSGQTGKAEKFLTLFQQNGGSTYESQGLQSEIMLTSCADLAAPMLKNTPFWNEKLAAVYENRIDKAVSIASGMSYSELKFDAMPEIFADELRDQAALLSIDPKKFTKYLEYNYGTQTNRGKMLRAKAALNQNKPQEALDLIVLTRSRYGSFKREQTVITASALQKLDRSKEAVQLVDTALNLKPFDWDSEVDEVSYGQVTADHHHQELLAVKARALCDRGKYKQALGLCASMLAQNPSLIEPRLIKIRCYQGLKDRKAETAESEKISSALAAWMNSAESTTHD